MKLVKGILIFIVAIIIAFAVWSSFNKAEAPKKDEPTDISKEKDIIDKEPNKTKDKVENLEKPEKKETSTSYVSDLGNVRIGKDGAIKADMEIKAPVTVDFFFDPICPACSTYNDVIGETMKEKINNGEIEVVFRPVPYLNEKTPDDYSNRASAYILAVSEYAPTKALPFIQKIISNSFLPSAPATDVTLDSKFIEAMSDVGLSKDEIDKVDYNKENFVSKSIAAGNDFNSKKSDWVKLSSNKNENNEETIFTPFILINKSGQLTNKSLTLNSGDLIKEFNDAVGNAK